MKEQYVLLRKENDLLNSLIGQSFNQKNKFEAEKILTEIHSKAQNRSIGKTALCYITDKDEIKGVGGSTLIKDKNGKIFSNLILDQFALVLAGLFNQPIAQPSFSQRTIKNISNSNNTVNLIQNEPFNDNDTGTLGCQMQVGSGSTTPLRTNFNIETAFGTAPESGFILQGTPVYNSSLGQIKFNGSIITGGAGTINEAGFFGQFKRSSEDVEIYMFFRDIISPAQAFVAFQTITVEYTIQL